VLAGYLKQNFGSHPVHPTLNIVPFITYPLLNYANTKRLRVEQPWSQPAIADEQKFRASPSSFAFHGVDDAEEWSKDQNVFHVTKLDTAAL
jgi:hypothetical protein